MSRMAFNVIRLGFEPKTHSLEGCCSIQLSYRTSPFLSSGDEPLPKVGAKIAIFFGYARLFPLFMENYIRLMSFVC